MKRARIPSQSTKWLPTYLSAASHVLNLARLKITFPRGYMSLGKGAPAVVCIGGLLIGPLQK